MRKPGEIRALLHRCCTDSSSPDTVVFRKIMWEGGRIDETHVFGDETNQLKVTGKTGCKLRTPGSLHSRCY